VAGNGRSQYREETLMPAGFDYVAPGSLDEAVSRLTSSGDARILAGGQGLLTDVKSGRESPALLVDLRNVPDLTEIGRTTNGVFPCGAMVTLDRLAASQPVFGTDSALSDCLRVFGDPQVRNRATVGGSLANRHAGVDLPAVALALGATINTVGPDGRHSRHADAFTVRPSGESLRSGEIATAVDWPVDAPGTGSAYQKVSNPGSGLALCGAAASVVVGTDGTVDSCRVALTGATERTVRLPKVEAALTGQAATADSSKAAAGRVNEEGLSFLGDLAAPADYRAHLAEILVGRALARASERARKVST
jgi:carbon-monoxide dehydrogenase medium subunit